MKKSTVRVDQTAAPSSPPPEKPPAQVPSWVRPVVLSIVGALMAVLCPMIPVPAVAAVCSAVGGIVHAIPTGAPVSSSFDGGSP